MYVRTVPTMSIFKSPTNNSFISNLRTQVYGVIQVFKRNILVQYSTVQYSTVQYSTVQ